jgi:hypothetical protein
MTLGAASREHHQCDHVLRTSRPVTSGALDYRSTAGWGAQVSNNTPEPTVCELVMFSVDGSGIAVGKSRLPASRMIGKTMRRVETPNKIATVSNWARAVGQQLATKP